MDIRIVIDRKNIGFDYKSVKSLLKKFEEVEMNKESITSLHITLDFNKSDLHELSNALLWRLMRRYQNLRCDEKFIKYSNQIRPELEKRHFLDRLIGRKSETEEDEGVPFHFESFEPFRDKKDAVDGISVETVYEKAMDNVLDPDNTFHAEVA